MALKNFMAAPKRFITVILILCSCLYLPAGWPARVQAQKNPKPEDVVELAIRSYYGTRAGLYGIQRNGTLRAQIKLITSDGTREGKSVMKFIRKEKLADDLVLIDLELPGTRYTIGFDGKETWSILDGEVQKPSE